MVDTNLSDPTAYTTQPLQAPPAKLSAEEIAEMRARWARVVGDVPVGPLDKSERGERLGHLIGSDMYRLLDALEALTAENARLTSEATINGERATYWRKKYAALGNEVIDRSGVAEADWYARHRAAVEAAHAAAKADRDPVSEWIGDEYDDITSRTLRNLSNPEFMAAAFGDDAAAKEAAE